MKRILINIIVLVFGLAQFSFSQTTCFQADNNYVFEGSSNSRSIAKGDFNNDGNIDIIMGNSTGSPNPTLTRLVYIQNNGGRSFSAPVEIESGSSVVDVVAVDIDNDGSLDVVLVSSNLEKLFVIKGNGDGTFQKPVGY